MPPRRFFVAIPEADLRPGSLPHPPDRITNVCIGGGKLTVVLEDGREVLSPSVVGWSPSLAIRTSEGS